MTIELQVANINQASYVRSLMRAWRWLGFNYAAVRSSGYSEDSAEKSFAGIFDSILNVRRENLLDAVAQVRRSFSQNTHLSYADAGNRGGIIVQQMVPAEWAGVLFTRHPKFAGEAIVEMVSGIGDKLVSGSATPTSYRLGRVSGRLLVGSAPPMDLAPLHALGRKAEGFFGRPQDIEWAYVKGKFYILQSRDITRMSSATASSDNEILDAERGRLLELFAGCDPGKTVLAQAEISELVPRPTPATLSLMESLWRPGGAIDHACRNLGLEYVADENAPPYLVSVFGNLYVNMSEASRRVAPLTSWKVSRIFRSADAIAREAVEEFEPEFLKKMAVLEALDAKRLQLSSLFDLFNEIRQRFVSETYVQASMVTLVATISLNEARRALEERNLSPANALGEMPETPMSQSLDALASLPKEARCLEDFLRVFGHRAPQDYELSCPRYAEDLKLADFTMISMLSVQRPRHAAHDAPSHDLRGDSGLATSVARARRFQALKERVKHQCLRELSVLRHVLLAIDQRLGLANGIFQLQLDEIDRLQDENFRSEAADLIQKRAKEARLFKRVKHLPAQLSVDDLETISLLGGSAKVASDPMKLMGTLVAGEAPVEGTAFIINGDEGFVNPEDIQALPADAIILTRLVHPQWLPWLVQARGVVCEVGGWLSHTAILAREYNLPMVVGVRGLDQIRQGDRLRLHQDGRVEKCLEAAVAAE